MIIKRLQLRNFRNYSFLDLVFDQRLNIIIGDNGAGKTNILESILLVSNTKSFRTKNDQELIKEQTDFSRIDLSSSDHQFRVVINREGKGLYIDNSNIPRTSDFIGKLNAVLFEPSDLELFSDSPRYRRRVLDLEIGKVSLLYLKATLEFNRLLKERNNLLKQNKIDRLLVRTLSERMSEPLLRIMSERKKFIDYVNGQISSRYKLLADDERTVFLDYQPSCEPDLGMIVSMYQKNEDRDILFTHTTKGSHKEDFNFFFDGHKIAEHASQGQKRIVMIAFKLALVDYIYTMTKHYPVLLLDDILSELDRHNRQRLLASIPKEVQTFITTTDIDEININKYRLIKIKKGGMI